MASAPAGGQDATADVAKDDGGGHRGQDAGQPEGIGHEIAAVGEHDGARSSRRWSSTTRTSAAASRPDASPIAPLEHDAPRNDADASTGPAAAATARERDGEQDETGPVIEQTLAVDERSPGTTAPGCV